jgi:hypothetical protein
MPLSLIQNTINRSILRYKSFYTTIFSTYLYTAVLLLIRYPNLDIIIYL